MSLICVLRTKHGIVMSADRRLTVDVPREIGDIGVIARREVITDHEQKLFQIGDYGMAYWGDSSEREPMSVTVETFIKTTDTSLGMRELTQSLKDYIRSVHGDDIACTFLLCGYDGKSDVEGTILACAVNKTEISTEQSNFLIGGDQNAITSLFLKTSIMQPSYNIGNAKDFLTFLNYAAASYQKFAGLAQTISEECDLLTLPRSLR